MQAAARYEKHLQDHGLEDTSRPPFLAPISTLGSAVTLLELTAPSCAAPGSYCLDETLDDCGGPKLPKHLKLTPQLFNARTVTLTVQYVSLYV